MGRYLWILENTFISMNSHSTNISAIHKGVEYPRYPKQWNFTSQVPVGGIISSTDDGNCVWLCVRMCASSSHLFLTIK